MGYRMVWWWWWWFNFRNVWSRLYKKNKAVKSVFLPRKIKPCNTNAVTRIITQSLLKRENFKSRTSLLCFFVWKIVLKINDKWIFKEKILRASLKTRFPGCDFWAKSPWNWNKHRERTVLGEKFFEFAFTKSSVDGRDVLERSTKEAWKFERRKEGGGGI